MTTDNLPDEGDYAAYDLMTNEYLGRYRDGVDAVDRNPGRAVTSIYRPRKRRKAGRKFP